jgi:hypothetical protein
MAYQKLQVGRAASVTPSDTANIPSVSGGTNNGCVLYVGSAGNLRVQTVGGDDVTFNNINTGAFKAMGLVNWIAISITSNLISQAPPIGSTDIISEIGVQMISEDASAQDLITEGQ